MVSLNFLVITYIDTQLQAYIRASRAQGFVVKSFLVTAGAMGIANKTNPSGPPLLENNAEILNKSWVKSILFRMGYVKHRGTTTAKINPDNFQSLQETILEQIQIIIKFEDIPLHLIFNWDQTGRIEFCTSIQPDDGKGVV